MSVPFFRLSAARFAPSGGWALRLVLWVLLLAAARLSPAAPPSHPPVAVAAAASSRESSDTLVTESAEMMGTFVGFRVHCPAGREEAAREAIAEARRRIESFVAVVSSWDPASDATRVNKAAGGAPVKVDPRLVRVLLRAREISGLSSGAFDVTFQPVGRLWNVRAKPPVLPADRDVSAALELVNWRDLLIDEAAGTVRLRRAGMSFELGGIAKGTAVDIAIEALRERGFESVCVNAGGDLRATGTRPGGGPWRIGIQSPRGEYADTFMNIELRDRAISTSGDYEKMAIINGRRIHHIIDTHTGRPSEKTISTTVIAQDAETADALATALFVLGPAEGARLARTLPGVEALWIDPAFHITRTDGFPVAPMDTLPLPRSGS